MAMNKLPWRMSMKAMEENLRCWFSSIQALVGMLESSWPDTSRRHLAGHRYTSLLTLCSQTGKEK